jgi:hypothetical protein
MRVQVCVKTEAKEKRRKETDVWTDVALYKEATLFIGRASSSVATRVQP